MNKTLTDPNAPLTSDLDQSIPGTNEHFEDRPGPDTVLGASLRWKDGMCTRTSLRAI